jgi:hypothetical protein
MSRMFEVILVSGRDARPFLQGQLTQDISRLGETPFLLAAWCNPKGRVIAVLRLVDDSQGAGAIGLVAPAALAEAVIERLLTFRFRARVDFELAGDTWAACAVTGEDDLAALQALDLLPAGGGRTIAHKHGLVAVDIGAAPRCVEVYGPVAAMQDAGLEFGQPLSVHDWRLALISAGIPMIEPATAERYTPHMLNLDCLGAISFSKGCYTGQEVVARTEYLGKSKRRLMRFRTEATAVRPGDKLRHEARDVGEVLNAVDDQLLAVVPRELGGKTLMINNHSAAPVPLPYPAPT